MYVRKSFDAGASGYVLKTGLIEELLDAIRKVMNGDAYVSPGLGEDVLRGLWNRSGQPSGEEESLTDRQLEVLQLIVEGRMSKEVAHILGISIKTVDFHRSRIMAKLGAHTTAELVKLAVEQGLIPPSTATDN